MELNTKEGNSKTGKGGHGSFVSSTDFSIRHRDLGSVCRLLGRLLEK